MTKLSFFIATIFALIFCFFTETANAQDDLPELILEETEDGYIIVNWEDTRVEDEEQQQGENQTPPVVVTPAKGKTSKNKSKKTKKVVGKVKKIIRRGSRKLRGTN